MEIIEAKGLLQVRDDGRLARVGGGSGGREPRRGGAVQIRRDQGVGIPGWARSCVGLRAQADPRRVNELLVERLS